jgi:hypothetical protein
MATFKHPAGPFTVLVSAYRISPTVDVRDTAAVYQSRHRCATAAARRLAQIIAQRTRLSADIQRCIPRDYSGRYVIVIGDGRKLTLRSFREEFTP